MKLLIKDLNIERARLSPSASINYSKSENKDFSSTLMKQIKKLLKLLLIGQLLKVVKIYHQLKNLLL